MATGTKKRFFSVIAQGVFIEESANGDNMRRTDVRLLSNGLFDLGHENKFYKQSEAKEIIGEEAVRELIQKLGNEEKTTFRELLNQDM